MTILAIGIHPDDIELGCGGTVALAAKQGHEVVLVDLADGAASSNGTVEERAREAQAAARILGVARRENLGFPDAGIQSENQDQLNAIVRSIRSIRPRLILAPSADDPHPDHSSGGRLIDRAVYMAGVHGYLADEPAWRESSVLIYPGRIDVEPDLVVDVTATHATKMDAVKAHVTQFGAGAGRKPTPLNSPEFMARLEARARLHGGRIGVRFGEPFEARQPLAVEDLGALFGGSAQ